MMANRVYLSALTSLVLGSLPSISHAINQNIDLCIVSTAGFGQKTSSLWCHADSCFLVQFSKANTSAQIVGAFGMAIDSITISKGLALATSARTKKDWSLKPSSSVTSIALGSESVFNIFRHPMNAPGLRGLEDWASEIKKSILMHSIWTDSLILQKVNRDSKQLSIRLDSHPKGGKHFGMGSILKFRQSKQKMDTLTGKSISWDSQIILPADCLENLVSGNQCLVSVAIGVRSMQVVLKSNVQEGLGRTTNSCLEGQFELMSQIYSW